ncbi:ead/Ea22-like family protein [Klebsiella pneumoniae]|uniref:ead/Ea22-like family protein n=2 Tax=Klebsiella pneumoniae TaxID=573 RepID=UPI003752BACE
MKKLLTKLRVISAVSKAQTLTALTTAARITPMTDITELAQRMKAAAEKATQGEWWADEVKNEGCYGSGDDCVEGFTSYAIYGSDGQTLFDSLNSDAACICEEYDGEGHVAWDETAQRNAEFIALANPANVLALVEALEKAQGMEAYWKTQCRGITDHCEELQARIAELESRTVTVKQYDEFQICHYGATEDYAKGYIDCQNNFSKWLTAAGINWEAK